MINRKDKRCVRQPFVFSLCLIFLCISCTLCFSATVFDRFHEHVTKYYDTYLDTLSRDVGAVLSGGIISRAQTHMFPGFDLHINMSLCSTDEDNMFFLESETAENMFKLTSLHFEMGITGDFDVMLKYFPYDGFRAYGAGLKYEFIYSPPGPVMSVSGNINTLDHDQVLVNAYSLNIMVSRDFPMFSVFTGAGFDKTVLESRVRGYETLRGESYGWRVCAGLKKRLYMIFDVQGSFVLSNGNPGMEIGAGVSF